MGARRILVVEDETIIGTFLFHLMTGHPGDYVIETAADGNTAIQKAIELRPHLVVLDIHIPGKHGLEVCREIRSLPNCSHTIILAMTGDPNPTLPAQVMQLGAVECLHKPFQLGAFLTKVRAYCDESMRREADPAAEGAG